MAQSAGMAPEGQMTDQDLPEPARRTFTPEEKLIRHWQLLVVFLTAVAAYAVLHKLLIPTALKFTTLKDTPYSQVDWWFVHPMILAFILQTNRRNTPVISFLAGIALLYGLYEIYEALQGRHTGWLMFSRLLSAVPLAIGSGYLMTQRRLGGSLGAAWVGALVLLLFITCREFWLPRKSLSADTGSSALKIFSEMPRNEITECGAQELIVKKGIHPMGSSQLTINACGFSPSNLTVEKGALEVLNLRKDAINLRLFLYENSKIHSKWNILIPANTKTTREIVLPPGTVGMILSDSSPQAGIVSLVPPITEGDWTFRRKPISIEETK